MRRFAPPRKQSCGGVGGTGECESERHAQPLAREMESKCTHQDPFFLQTLRRSTIIPVDLTGRCRCRLRYKYRSAYHFQQIYRGEAYFVEPRREEEYLSAKDVDHSSPCTVRRTLLHPSL